MVASANPANIPIMTSFSGQDAFIRGQSVNGYIMNASQALTVQLPYDPTPGNGLETSEKVPEMCFH